MSINVEYKIYFKDTQSAHALSQECSYLTSALAKDYIWQKEPFVLNVNDESGLPSLIGNTDVGENISDEWFIVYLLYQISKKFVDVIIQITDDDGEFLLIEAADTLPTWLKPDSSENRVFICRGEIHIIPYPTNPSEIMIYPTSTPSLHTAFDLIIGKHVIKPNKEIQNAISNRIDCYPLKIDGDFHHAHCFIPEEIIYILHEKPKMVAQAVQAFYERDQLDKKTCQKLEHFQPGKRLLAMVKFTKYLYGQLTQASFIPDQNSPWKLPKTSAEHYKAYEIGYKLTCGFQILLSRHGECAQDVDGEPSGRFWNQYLENLNKRGFFQNELEGSKHYKELMIQAKQHFKDSFSNKQSTDGKENEIINLLKEASEHTDDIKQLCENLPPQDSDDWMVITTEELNNMLKENWTQDFSEESGVDHLSKLVKNMKTFVGNVSSYEGAEIPCEINKNNDKNDDGDDDGDDIIFDPTTFMDTVQSLLNPPSQNLSNEDDEDSSDDEEDDIDDPDMVNIMNQMDSELKSSSIPKSFQQSTKNEDDGLDVDYNLVKNFLESFSSQDGLSGPVSNILNSMGMVLPPDDGT